MRGSVQRVQTTSPGSTRRPPSRPWGVGGGGGAVKQAVQASERGGRVVDSGENGLLDAQDFARREGVSCALRDFGGRMELRSGRGASGGGGRAVDLQERPRGCPAVGGRRAPRPPPGVGAGRAAPSPAGGAPAGEI